MDNVDLSAFHEDVRPIISWLLDQERITSSWVVQVIEQVPNNDRGWFIVDTALDCMLFGHREAAKAIACGEIPEWQSDIEALKRYSFLKYNQDYQTWVMPNTIREHLKNRFRNIRKLDE